MTPFRRQALKVALALLALALMGFFTADRLVQVRTDMAAFLPPGDTAAQRFLIGQLREGPGTTLILVGIEAGTAASDASAAAISTAMAQSLKADPHFLLVANGASGLDGSEQEILFHHRYLLSAKTGPAAFTAEALHADLTRLLGQIGGLGGMMAAELGLADPIGTLPDILKAWLGQSQPSFKHGVWFAPDEPGRPPRALLLLRVAGAGLDIEGMRAAQARIEAAFTAAAPKGQARLLLSGPGIFAVQAADAIKHDATLVSIVSSLFVILFLYYRHRSILVLAAVLITLGTGALIASLVVQAVFGFVHGITLGFGMTMLGVTADYPLLIIGQRRAGESLLAAACRLSPTLAQAVGAALLGLMAMLMSSFPGLAQLGLFSVVGVASAGLMTRFVLPYLTSAIHVRDQSAAPIFRALAAGLRRYRGWTLLLALAAILVILGGGGVHFTTDLAALSPVAKEAQDLDETMRRQLGAPDVRHLIAILGADEETVLQAAERLAPSLDGLVAAGTLGSFDLPSRYLPSIATQRARQAALPSAENLKASLGAAMAGLPFKPGAFDPFLAEIAAERQIAPLTKTDFKSPALRARLDALLQAEPGDAHGVAASNAGNAYGIATLNDVRDPARIAESLAKLSLPGLVLVDIKGETESLLGAYLNEALRWLGLGGLAMLLMLILIRRDARALLRIAGPALAGVLAALAVLGLSGKTPTLFDLASLLLMVGVSLDYGLFLNRTETKQARPAAKEAALALGSVLNCAAATLATFGLLVFCRNPVLSGIGLTVISGVLTALILAVAFSPAPHEEVPA